MEIFISVLFFFIFNPFSITAWITIFIAFLIPWEYLGLWITIVITAWAIVLFPFNRPYTDDDFAFLGELVIYVTNLTLFIGMSGVIVIRLLKQHRHQQNSATNQLGRFLSYSACGILSACFSYLFLTNFWHNYQPAWQAYGYTFTATFLLITTCLLFQTYSKKGQRQIWIKKIFAFVYSFTISSLAILVSNLLFPILAIKETKKIVKYRGDINIKHCIQTDRKTMKSWLYLTPLTAWNKPNGSQGAGLRHAVLVIDKNDEYVLYHWSYRLRKWEFNSVGFEPGGFTVPDRLKCKPETGYWSYLPLILPK